jgi:hypothetical protein
VEGGKEAAGLAGLQRGKERKGERERERERESGPAGLGPKEEEGGK